MPGKLIIEVTETDHGFQARVPGTIAGEINGFGATIPGALRKVGEGLVDFKEALAANGYSANYTDVMKELSRRQQSRLTGVKLL